MASSAKLPFGLPADADEDTRIDSSKNCVSLYMNMGYKGDTLSEHFTDELKRYILQNFNTVSN